MDSIIALVGLAVFFGVLGWGIRERQKVCKWLRLPGFVELADEKTLLERELEDVKVRSARRIADLEKALKEYEQN